MIQLEGWTLRPVEAGSAASSRLPQQWWPIAESVDPDTRCSAALALWPPDFLALAPGFARQLTDQLTDVRAYLSDTEPVLVYEAELVDGNSGDRATWIGRDPRTFTPPSPLWECLPQPVRDFQRTVHAGFTAPNRESYGLMHPAHLQTVTEMAHRSLHLPFWDSVTQLDGWIESDRLLPITRDCGNLWLCVSPDLPEGYVAMNYEGDVDSQEFTSAFDDLMTGAFEAG